MSMYFGLLSFFFFFCFSFICMIISSFCYRLLFFYFFSSSFGLSRFIIIIHYYYYYFHRFDSLCVNCWSSFFSNITWSVLVSPSLSLVLWLVSYSCCDFFDISSHTHTYALSFDLSHPFISKRSSRRHACTHMYTYMERKSK